MKIDNRLWVVITIVVCAVLVAGGWFLGVQPQLAAASAADEQRAGVDSQNAAISTEVRKLTALKGSEAELKTHLSELTSSIPAGVDGQGFLRELEAVTTSSGATLQSWSLAEPTPYTPPAAPAAPESESAAGSTASPSPSASASASAEPAPAATSETAGIAPLTDPLITSSNFITVPVTIAVSGSDEQVTAFLSGIQHTKRLILVTKAGKTATDDGIFTLSVQGTIYVLRDPSTVAAATTPAAGSTATGS